MGTIAPVTSSRFLPVVPNIFSIAFFVILNVFFLGLRCRLFWGGGMLRLLVCLGA